MPKTEIEKGHIKVKMLINVITAEGTLNAGQEYERPASEAFGWSLCEWATIVEGQRKPTAEERREGCKIALDMVELQIRKRGTKPADVERVPFLRRSLERIEKAASAA